MKIFINGVESTVDDLREAYNNLDPGPADGGDFEELVLTDIDADGNLYFEVYTFSAF